MCALRFCQAYVYIGETVCKIIKTKTKKLLLFTLSGSVYEVRLFDDDFCEHHSNALEQLQFSVMRHLEISPKYRSGSISLKSFIDIDFLSRWLELPSNAQQHLLDSITKEANAQSVISILNRISR